MHTKQLWPTAEAFVMLDACNAIRHLASRTDDDFFQVATMPQEKGNHACLSEDWLLDNLPKGWSYDCYIPFTSTLSAREGFTISSNGKAGTLFVPLDLLKRERN